MSKQKMMMAKAAMFKFTRIQKMVPRNSDVSTGLEREKVT